MTPFEYLSVLVSIILGLGLAHLLSAVRELIQKRAQVRFYPLALVWAALIFTTQVQWWWGIYELRTAQAWNFFSFFFLLLAPVSMYLTAGMVLPDIEGDERSREVRGIGLVNGEFEAPFVLVVTDNTVEGSDDQQPDRCVIQAGNRIGTSGTPASGGWGYAAEGELVGGDLLLIGQENV